MERLSKENAGGKVALVSLFIPRLL